MTETTVQIILPPTAATNIELDLVSLTEYIWKTHHVGEAYGYGLGGEFGYGTEYDNDVFSMFPFYWGDCDCGYEDKAAEFSASIGDHPPTCFSYRYIAEDDRLRDAGIPWDHRHEQMTQWSKANGYATAPSGMAVHCTCGLDAKYRAWSKANPHPKTCPTERPNFLHKASGLEISWYKWIGRDTEYSRKPSPKEWRRIFDECVASVE